MTRLLSSPITYIVLVLFVAASAILIASLLSLRAARRGSYWRQRRQAGQRGGQLFLVAMALYGVTFVIAFFTGFATFAIDEVNDLLFGTPNPFPGLALPTATFTPNFPTPDVEGTLGVILTSMADSAATQTAQVTPPPTDTVTPTATPIMPTMSPTTTTTPTDTVTPTPTFDLVLELTPPPSTIQPRRNAVVAITAASLNILADGSPDQPMEIFSPTAERIYFILGYENMTDGITWTRVLYRDGVPIQGGTYRWTLGASGQSFFFFGREGGYLPGQYEVRLFLGIAEVSRFRFRVSGDESH